MTFLTLYAAIIVTTGCVQPGISDAAITSIIVVFNVSIVTYTMIEEVLEGSDVSEIGSEVLGCASLLASKLGGAVSNVSDDARDDMPASGEQGAGGGRAGGGGIFDTITEDMQIPDSNYDGILARLIEMYESETEAAGAAEITASGAGALG